MATWEVYVCSVEPKAPAVHGSSALQSGGFVSSGSPAGALKCQIPTHFPTYRPRATRLPRCTWRKDPLVSTVGEFCLLESPSREPCSQVTCYMEPLYLGLNDGSQMCWAKETFCLFPPKPYTVPQRRLEACCAQAA